MLSPLTALLVVQVTLYQTLHSAPTRTASAVAEVLRALGLAAWVGFTWWSLGIRIALALAIGYMLRLGETILDVPISAMLILLVDTRAAQAIADLCFQMADLLRRLAGVRCRHDCLPYPYQASCRAAPEHRQIG